VWIAAAEKGDAQAMAAWLDEGGGVDAGCAEFEDGTLLMNAAQGGQEAVVRMLLQRGASVNLQDSLGGTGLICAAVNGHTTTVQVLLEAKADASLQTTNGSTALRYAEHYKHTAAAQLLRQHTERQAADAAAVATKAAPSTATAGSAAAVMDKALIAAGNGDAQAVAEWLSKGGGVDARCAERDGATLLMVAATGAQEAVVRMLL
jgi:ankyrin repeat protein